MFYDHKFSQCGGCSARLPAQAGNAPTSPRIFVPLWRQKRKGFAPNFTALLKQFIHKDF
jgi:hypothetical protein